MKKLSIYLIVLTLVVALSALPAAAQDDMDDWGPATMTPEPVATDEGPEGMVSLDFRAADIGDVLRALFRDSGASYVLSPDVKGRVTVSLNEVPFSVALRSVLEQVKATFRREGNVYSVLLATEISGDDEATMRFRTPQRLRVLEVRFADAYELAYLFGGTASGAYGNYGAFGDYNITGGGGRGGRGNIGVGTNRNNNNFGTNRNTGSSFGTGATTGGYSNIGGGSMGGGMGGGFGGFSFGR